MQSPLRLRSTHWRPICSSCRRGSGEPSRNPREASTLAYSATEGSLLATIDRLLEPPKADDAPPPWLLPEQRDSFARAVWAVRRLGLALVADPPGSGKTYVALAAASVLSPAGRTACIVPAVLVGQWRAAAERLRVPVDVHSHEKTSRGREPAGPVTLAIIDESHRFRTPSTKRYGILAPWLVGKSVVLLTGTPLVNRAVDLLHQLKLGVCDDALARFGIPSLGSLLEAQLPHPALTRLVVSRRHDTRTDAAPGAARPRRRLTEVSPGDAVTAELAVRIDGLRLSAAPEIGALVRVGLLRALASSPAALVDALRRYRSLLRHAADAAAAGRPVTRRDLRAAVGSDEAQLVLWPLLQDPAGSGAVELDACDLPMLEVLIASGRQAPDAKAARLATLLADRRSSIVFVTHRATVGHLRRHLPGLRVAWCTGSAAGVDGMRAPRAAVLGAFDPAATECAPMPDVLIATDVAAEGLDLQRAERIVHYDLPWTPTRLRQREGRALRLGSSHSLVEVVRFRPSAAVELRLGLTSLLQRKEGLPGRLGVAEPASGSRGRGDDAPEGRAAEREGFASELLIVAAIAANSTGRVPGPGAVGPPSDVLVVLRRPDGALVTDRGAITEALRRVPSSDEAGTSSAVDLSGPSSEANTEAATTIGMAALRQLERLGTDGAPPAPRRSVPSDLLARLTLVAGAAAKARDDELLERVEAALSFLRRPRTAGEEAHAARLARCSTEELRRAIRALPASRPADPAWEPCLVIPLGRPPPDAG